MEAAKTLVVKVMSKSLDSTTLSAEKRKYRPSSPRRRAVSSAVACDNARVPPRLCSRVRHGHAVSGG